MVLGILVSVASVVLWEALGHWVQHVLHFSKNKEYGFPLGIVASFGILEFLFLIGIGLHFGRGWFVFWTIVLIAFMLFTLWSQHTKTFHSLFRWQSLVVLGSCILGFFLVKQYASLDINFVDGSLLQGFPLWQQALQYCLRYFQISFGLWIIVMSLWFLGSLTFNIVDSFHLKNPWFCFCVLLAGIFFSSFRSHQLIQLGSMNYWRMLLASYLLFVLYRLFSEKEEVVHVSFIPMTILAGLFVSDGFVLISVELLLAYFIFCLSRKEIRILYCLIFLNFPLVLYFASYLGQKNVFAFLLVAIGYGFLLKIRDNQKVYVYLIDAEMFFLDYYKMIFFVICPIILVLVTLFLRFAMPDNFITYHSFLNYIKAQPVNYYFFIRSNWLEIILSTIRWIGVIIFLWQSHKREEDRWVRTLLVMMVLWFVNPLTMGLLVKMSGLNALTLGFEILFNPLTDLLSFIAIYEMFQWTVIGQWVLELVLVLATLFGHTFSYLHVPAGLYTNLIDGTMEVKK
ncbi:MULTISPECIES: hypothetical protein [Terrabacteria group]|uniref:hypothetical protein n=1 Tax=Bacillati TaxID=1783272 RepID=UPI001C6ED29B|nr:MULTISPECIES: hypothetical protein [Terrabacteria group]MBW9212261.1 hypothetical protein [Trueperella sp. zg.1013]